MAHPGLMAKSQKEKTALMLSLRHFTSSGSRGKKKTNHFISKPVKNWVVYSSRLFERVLSAGERDPCLISRLLLSLLSACRTAGKVEDAETVLRRRRLGSKRSGGTTASWCS